MAWSFAMGALTFLGMFLQWQLGNGRRWPWIVMALSGVPFAIYNVATRQYGFMPSCLIGMAVQLRNWTRHGGPG